MARDFDRQVRRGPSARCDPARYTALGIPVTKAVHKSVEV